jgi:MoaA/NifB/PqqE/SkfB family radical SAM enzyme
MDYGPYSPLKAAHPLHADRIRALAEGRLLSPSQVSLVVTNKCNQDCLFCAYRSSRARVSQMFTEMDEIGEDRLVGLPYEFKKAGVLSVLFAGGGEPTVHPGFGQALKTTLDLGMYGALLTNGSLLHEMSKDDLARLTWARVSIDSASAETYAIMHGSSDETYYRVLESASELARSRNGYRPVVGIGFVVCQENHEEVGDFIRLGATLGIDNVRISPSFFEDAVETHMGYYDKVMDLINQASSEVAGKVMVFNQFGNLLEALAMKKPEFPTCHYARMVTYVGADLNVYTCCDLSYNKAGLIGSIKEMDFGTFWNEKAAEFYRLHSTVWCGSCKSNDKNRLIQYLLSDAAVLHAAYP